MARTNVRACKRYFTAAFPMKTKNRGHCYGRLSYRVPPWSIARFNRGEAYYVVPAGVTGGFNLDCTKGSPASLVPLTDPGAVFADKARLMRSGVACWASWGSPPPATARQQPGNTPLMILVGIAFFLFLEK